MYNLIRINAHTHKTMSVVTVVGPTTINAEGVSMSMYLPVEGETFNSCNVFKGK